MLLLWCVMEFEWVRILVYVGFVSICVIVGDLLVDLVLGLNVLYLCLDL